MGRAVDRLFRNPDTGALVIAQWPNPPLAVYLAATALRLALRPDGAAGTAVDVVAGVSLAWWAVDEILRGDSPFRRVLGAGVLLTSVWGLVTR